MWMTQHRESDAPSEGLGVERRPRPTLIASCAGGNCPAIFRTTHGTLVIQGRAITGDTAGIEPGPGEALVEVPESLFADLLGDAGRTQP
jgi:hypothetical protein